MIKQKNTVLSLFPGSLLAVLLTGVAAHALAGEICITTESDPDGDGFGWEQESSCLVTEASATVPTVFHPRTNEQLNVQRITWVEADFADRSFSGCDGYLVDPDHEQDSCLSCGSEENTDYQHFADGNGRLVYSFGESSLEAEFTWGVDIYGIYFGPLPITGFAEITADGIRQWQSGQPGESGFYEQCDGAIPSTMLQTAVETTVSSEPNTSTESIARR